MSDLSEQLRSYVEANIERIDVEDVRATASQPSTTLSSAPPKVRPVWAFLLGAAAVVVLGGIAGFLRGGLPAAVDDVLGSPGWNPILSTASAKTTPIGTVCPAGSAPSLVGPLDQARPWGAQWSNQAAAFDARMGRIVLLDESGETWTFDVCTNVWLRMRPQVRSKEGMVWPEDPDGWLGQLVHDVDSGVTVAFRGESLAVYDSEANTWTLRSQPPEYDTGIPGSGAFYHPESGLLVVQTWESGLVAYDVDSDTWAPIGRVEWAEQVPPYLVGYLQETGQFVFLGGFDERGMLVDARTGRTTEIAAPGDRVIAGFGRLGYATAGEGVYVESDDGICRLDPAELSWDCLGFWYEQTGEGSGLLSAIVEDPIHDRIVLIYGYGPGFGETYYEVNDIWAVDFSNGRWTQLLERTGEVRDLHGEGEDE